MKNQKARIGVGLFLLTLLVGLDARAFTLVPAISLNPPTSANFTVPGCGFLEGGGPISIVPNNATVTDSGTINSATVTITNLFDTNSEILAATPSGAIQASDISYNASTGVLTITRSTTTADYQAVFRTVTYNNTKINPTTTSRSVSFNFVDSTGASPAAQPVSTVPVNAKPVLLPDGATAGFTSSVFQEGATGSGPVSIVDPNKAVLTDSDSDNITGLTASITNLQNAGNEILSATTTGTAVSASYSTSTGVLTLSGSDTPANYQKVLRTITYNNTSSTAAITPGLRTITLVATDQCALSSLTATSTVPVAPPVINTGPTIATAGIAFSYTIPATHSPTSFTAANLPAGLSLDVNTGIISGTPTTVGSSTVNLTATNAAGTGSATLALTVNAAPIVGTVTTSENPALVSDPVTFNGSATDPAGLALTLSWDFGDGSTATGGSVTHAFAAEGNYQVTFGASNGGPPATSVFTQQVLGPNSGGTGVVNIDNGLDDINPINGMGIDVLASNGGVIKLGIDIDALNRAQFAALTSTTGVKGTSFGSVAGLSPVFKFSDANIYVATATATDVSTGVVRAKARKTLPISRKETGQQALADTDPSSNVITPKSFKGKFSFASAAAASAPKLDQVAFTGTIHLPGGLDLSKSYDVAIAVGNVIDTVKVDAKGRAQLPGTAGLIKHLQFKYPHLKASAKTPANSTAGVTVQLVGPNFSTAGFDTEGITANLASTEAGQKTVKRSIQVALVLAGYSYDVQAPVNYSVSTNKLAGLFAGAK